jgi:hypothetical protein
MGSGSFCIEDTDLARSGESVKAILDAMSG